MRDRFTAPSWVDTLSLPAFLMAHAIGRLTREAGFGDLIKAWRSVAARWPAARLWIIGDGPERARLERLAGPRTRLVGRVGAERLR
mgnify:CR=1 FL=1